MVAFLRRTVTYQCQTTSNVRKYHLWLQTSYRIHPVFHISLLEPYQRRPDDANVLGYPASDLMDDDEIGDVEKIFKEPKRQGVLKYLVRWVGYPKNTTNGLPKKMLMIKSARRQQEWRWVRRPGGTAPQDKVSLGGTIASG